MPEAHVVRFERVRAARRRWLDRRRGIRFYRQFLGRGDLCFDVGAHTGNRTSLFLATGARVVAVEPQASCQAELERTFGDRAGFTLVGAALGPATGEADLVAKRPGSVLATLSQDWRRRVEESGRFAGVQWRQTEHVRVTTLDSLIERYGAPAFAKIDVEGYEREVLDGLATAVPSLSIEFTPEHLAATEACVDRLLRLGPYEFNFALGESLVLVERSWLDEHALLAALRRYERDHVVFGDVYARLRTAA